MKISCVPGDLKANIGKIRDFSAQAKKSGIELIVFPEMVDTGYSMPAIQEHATSWNEGAVPKLQETAKELSIAILVGVSQSGDPTGAWSLYRVDADSTDATWADYPSMGIDTGRVVIQVNHCPRHQILHDSDVC